MNPETQRKLTKLLALLGDSSKSNEEVGQLIGCNTASVSGTRSLLRAIGIDVPRPFTEATRQSHSERMKALWAKARAAEAPTTEPKTYTAGNGMHRVTF